MAGYRSKNIQTVPVPRDSSFVLITSSMNKEGLKRMGYDATYVMSWGISDPWHGTENDYIRTWQVLYPEVPRNIVACRVDVECVFRTDTILCYAGCPREH
jgi:hypothetical protein